MGEGKHRSNFYREKITKKEGLYIFHLYILPHLPKHQCPYIVVELNKKKIMTLLINSEEKMLLK